MSVLAKYLSWVPYKAHFHQAIVSLLPLNGP